MDKTGHRSLDGVQTYFYGSKGSIISDILNYQNHNTLLFLSPVMLIAQMVSSNSKCLAMMFSLPPILNFHGCTVKVNFKGKQLAQ